MRLRTAVFGTFGMAVTAYFLYREPPQAVIRFAQDHQWVDTPLRIYWLATSGAFFVLAFVVWPAVTVWKSRRRAALGEEHHSTTLTGARQGHTK